MYKTNSILTKNYTYKNINDCTFEELKKVNACIGSIKLDNNVTLNIFHFIKDYKGFKLFKVEVVNDSFDEFEFDIDEFRCMELATDDKYENGISLCGAIIPHKTKITGYVFVPNSQILKNVMDIFYGDKLITFKENKYTKVSLKDQTLIEV